MVANVVGMTFVPSYDHIVKLIETDSDLKKTVHVLNLLFLTG